MKEMKMENSRPFNQSDRAGGNSLEIYLRSINKTKLLSADQEAGLAKKIREGKPATPEYQADLDALVKANTRFVVSVAKQYRINSNAMSLNDLINEGNIGLIEAAKHFDERTGFRFISYAGARISQHIYNALVEKARLVRLPVNKITELNKLRKTRDFLENKFQTEISLENALQMGDLELSDDIGSAAVADNHPKSLDAPASVEEDSSPLYALIEDINENSQEKIFGDTEKLKLAFERLTDDEKIVIKMNFGFNQYYAFTLERISEETGYGLKKVTAIRDSAIRKLKSFMRN